MFVAVIAYKIARLRSRWESPRLWTLVLTLLFPSVVMALSLPDVQRAVSRLTGVTNLAPLLVYVFTSALAGCFLCMALMWRYPAGTAWPRIRWILVAYGSEIVAIAGLFAFSSVPEERVLDFDLHYATDPITAAWTMIAIVSVVIAVAILAYLCFSWARDQRINRWLRMGLRLYGTAGLVLGLNHLFRSIVIVTLWFGVTALKPAATLIPLLVTLLGTIALTGALLVPVWGPRLSAARRWMSRWRVFLGLRPLHRALQPVDPTVVFIASRKRFDPHHRVRRMVIELSDWRYTLMSLFDPVVEESAARSGREAGLTGEQLKASVEAIRLKTAALRLRHGSRTAVDAPAQRHDDARNGADFEKELDWWLRVARAFGH
ncbi:MAB_1171c family putative transporter [Nonomuraea lactucae]|uniref:MAB_1171c family putative transporter n=1 Tax=Nonomuraea lactucae TaxID=2249762 RepID=UPI003083F533